MKACLLSSPAPIDRRPLNYVEVETPSPGPDEVLVRVKACGVCRTDLHVVEGDLPPRLPSVIPGHQVVGEVAGLGSNVESPAVGDRVGIAWLRRTCGACRFCRAGKENLCERAEFNGWTANGGFAEYVLAPAKFVYSLPAGFDDLQAAPLLCAGIIGYRSLRLTGIENWSGARLGIYGFGAAGHVVIQVARARGADVYVCTRDRERHQALARELGAVWVGDAADAPPAKLDASIIFAPAGELVPPALHALDKGGVLVLGGIHMSPIPSFDYSLIYHERLVRSVANNTREDGREFLVEAAKIPVRTHVQEFHLEDANDALIALKHDAIRGAAVLVIDSAECQNRER
ncbi:MAG TPA: zinc-dependent alcohol dehydrogenase family protein [Pyrinomonadaceae bacterium]|nr:zinc-dependent alcohol dehydrogenase family protein [Pyrinomonadaceae bacterium]